MQVLTEFGLGTSLRRGDYTEASARALSASVGADEQAAALLGSEQLWLRGAQPAQNARPTTAV